MIYEGDINKLTKEGALEQINIELSNPDGEYLDVNNKHPRIAQERAKARMDRLYEIAYGKSDTLTGYVDGIEAKKNQQLIDIHGKGFFENKSSKGVSDAERASRYPDEKAGYAHGIDPTEAVAGVKGLKTVVNGQLVEYGQNNVPKADFSGQHVAPDQSGLPNSLLKTMGVTPKPQI